MAQAKNSGSARDARIARACHHEEHMNRLLPALAIAVFALALTACGPKEKHLASGAAIGAAAGVAGAVILDEDPLAGAALGGIAGTAGGYLYDEHRKKEKREERWEKRAERWEKHHKKPKPHSPRPPRHPR
jgi:hypothetical protein